MLSSREQQQRAYYYSRNDNMASISDCHVLVDKAPAVNNSGIVTEIAGLSVIESPCSLDPDGAVTYVAIQTQAPVAMPKALNVRHERRPSDAYTTQEEECLVIQGLCRSLYEQRCLKWGPYVLHTTVFGLLFALRWIPGCPPMLAPSLWLLLLIVYFIVTLPILASSRFISVTAGRGSQVTPVHTAPWAPVCAPCTMRSPPPIQNVHSCLIRRKLEKTFFFRLDRPSHDVLAVDTKGNILGVIASGETDLQVAAFVQQKIERFIKRTTADGQYRQEDGDEEATETSSINTSAGLDVGETLDRIADDIGEERSDLLYYDESRYDATYEHYRDDSNKHKIRLVNEGRIETCWNSDEECLIRSSASWTETNVGVE